MTAFHLVPAWWLLRLRARHLAGRGPAPLRRVRRSVLAAARLRGVPQRGPFAVAGLPGVRMAPADSRITAYVFWLGLDGHEPGEPAWWAALVASHTGVLELGANVGVYTLAGASAAPDRPYRAVEPNPVSVDALRRNLALNGLAGVEVVHAAAVAGPDQREAVLRFPPGDPYAASAGAFVGHPEPGRAAPDDRSVTVPAACVAGLVEGVDLLKLDIEGSELPVLRALRPWLVATRPTLLVEVLPTEHDLQRFVGGLVMDAGYECVVVDDGRPRQVPAEVVTAGHLMRDHGSRDITLVTPERLDRARRTLYARVAGAPAADVPA